MSIGRGVALLLARLLLLWRTLPRRVYGTNLGVFANMTSRATLKKVLKVVDETSHYILKTLRAQCAFDFSFENEQ